MRGTNSVGLAVVRLDHFPIDPGFSTMTWLWFGIYVTPSLDWFVLYTRRLIVVCFAIMPFLKDVFFHNVKVNHGRCQEVVSGGQQGPSAA